MGLIWSKSFFRTPNEAIREEPQAENDQEQPGNDDNILDGNWENANLENENMAERIGNEYLLLYKTNVISFKINHESQQKNFFKAIQNIAVFNNGRNGRGTCWPCRTKKENK